MSLDRATAALFWMHERTWARHANSWGVWTRVSILLLMILAIWSPVWIRAWAWLPVGTLFV
jgi:hypothetical protein